MIRVFVLPFFHMLKSLGMLFSYFLLEPAYLKADSLKFMMFGRAGGLFYCHTIRNSRYSLIDHKITLHLLSPIHFLYSLLCISICCPSVPDKIILKRNTALILGRNKMQAFQYISPDQRVLLRFHDHTMDPKVFIYMP